MSFELTPSQQLFLNIYSSQYENISQQFDRLIEESNRLIPIMNDLRYNINAIYIDARADLISNTNAGMNRQPRMPQRSSYPMPSYPINPNLTHNNVNVAPLLTTTAYGITDYLFGEVQNPINNTCPISLDQFDETSEVAQINRCGHLFFRNELQEWLQSNTRCPVCRGNINYYIDASNNIIT